MNKFRILSLTFVAVAFASVMSSCGGKDQSWEFARNMYDALAFDYDQPNPNFANGQTAQLPPDGTTPVGFDREIDQYPNTMEGYTAAGLTMKNPLPVTAATMSEGKVYYRNMCSHCHGATGNGDGTVVTVGGFPPPPSYSTGNSSRGGAMKDLSDGKIYHTITYGVNLMGPHRSQLSPTERWKIVMYVHELQKAQ